MCDIFLDSASRIVMLSRGSGFLDVIPLLDEDRFGPTQRISTREDGRTCLFNPTEKKVYLAIPEHGSETAEIRIRANCTFEPP